MALVAMWIISFSNIYVDTFMHCGHIYLFGPAS